MIAHLGVNSRPHNMHRYRAVDFRCFFWKCATD